MAFENFEVGEIVRGRHAGVFLIRKFDQGLSDEPFVMLKEVNPDDHSEQGPNPELAFTEDMIQKL